LGCNSDKGRLKNRAADAGERHVWAERAYQHPDGNYANRRRVADAGDGQRAAAFLGISRQRVNAHLKRLDHIAGGRVFEKTMDGKLALTSRGKVVVALARKWLASNDEILALKDDQRLRVGLTTNYAEYLLSQLTRQDIESGTKIITGYSAELAHLLANDGLDIACLANAPTNLGEPSFSWIETFSWVCNKKFEHRVGDLLPLVACGGILGETMFNALERADVPFSVTFSSADHNARVMATAAGMGLTALPERHVRKPLVVAKHIALPAMATLRMDVLVRPGIEPPKIARLMGFLKALAPTNFRRTVK
jgi:DNA-binding transcriptional LysR family regulator